MDYIAFVGGSHAILYRLTLIKKKQNKTKGMTLFEQFTLINENNISRVSYRALLRNL